MDYNRPGPSRRVVSHNDTNVFSMDFQSSDPPSPNTAAFQQPEMNSFQPNPNTLYNPNNQFNQGANQFNSFYQPPPPPGMQQDKNSFGGNVFANQQFLMSAGQQLLSNPMTAAAIDAYSQSLVDKSKGWIGNVNIRFASPLLILLFALQLKAYFAVDTSYVVKKLLLIFIPFLHKDWSIRYSSESVAPRDEPNLPDLYIPSMAFITYILLSGYILGLQNRFAPEQLGIYASSALAWLLLEVFAILIAKYLMNINSFLGFYHMVAFGGYKFVCIVAILLSTIMFGQTGFFAVFCYTAFSLGYFLLRTLNSNLQTTSQSAYSGENPRSGQYLVILVCLFQPVVMYFLSSYAKA